MLEFLIKRGSDQCVENAQVLLSKLEDLQVFEYTSPDGRDHGVNVRHRYANVTICDSLLQEINRQVGREACMPDQLGCCTTFMLELQSSMQIELHNT